MANTTERVMSYRFPDWLIGAELALKRARLPDRILGQVLREQRFPGGITQYRRLVTYDRTPIGVTPEIIKQTRTEIELALFRSGITLPRPLTLIHLPAITSVIHATCNWPFHTGETRAEAKNNLLSDVSFLQYLFTDSNISNLPDPQTIEWVVGDMIGLRWLQYRTTMKESWLYLTLNVDPYLAYQSR